MRRIVILGGGESGVGTAILAKKSGYEVFLSDNNTISDYYKSILQDKHIDFEECTHSLEQILNADIIVKSPGIPDKTSIIQKIIASNILIISEIEFASQFTKAKIIGITGTNGKTTTTLLTYHLLKTAGFNVGLAGNIGKSFAWQIAENEYSMYVLELSSFQIDGMYSKFVDIAVITNITPDHLDRYDYDYKLYINAKRHLLDCLKPDGLFIYCSDSEPVNTIASNFNGFKISYGLEKQSHAMIINHAFSTGINTIGTQHSVIQGKHNQLNTLAGILIAEALSIDKTTLVNGLESFKNAPHRLEIVGNINGATYINDSKATNIDATWYALDAMNKPVIWIIGGIDKGNDYSVLLSLVKLKVKYIVTLGKDNSKIIDYFENQNHITVYNCTSLKACFETCLTLGQEHDTILLSPACASFDLFNNYEDRGNQFREIVENEMRKMNNK